MALLWADGFDGIGDWSGETCHWDYWDGGVDISSAWGRRAGSNGIGDTYLYGNAGIRKDFSAVAVAIAGSAVRRTTSGNNSSLSSRRFLWLDPVFIRFADGSYTLEVLHGGEGGTLLGATSLPLQLNVWTFVEVKVVVSDTVGSVEVRFDGVVVLNLTSLNLGTTGISACNVYPTTTGTNNGRGLNWDDFYLCDDTGTTNNDFLGDVRVDAYLPTSDGIYQDFDLSTGTDAYALLDENPPTVADYVSSATVGHKVSTKITAVEKTDALGNVLPILGVVASNICNNPEGGGIRKVKPIAKSGSTEVQGSEVTLSNLYNRTPQILETDPDTGVAWDVTSINAAEFGIEVTA